MTGAPGLRGEAESPRRRLDALRAELARRDLAGFVQPHGDEHLSEYVPPHARRLAWLTGFRGSTGTAAVLRETAAIFVDGRYTLQAGAQVERGSWCVEDLDEDAVGLWLARHASPGDRIGVDPWLHRESTLRRWRASLSARGVTLVEVRANPIDSIWLDQPARGGAPVSVHPLEHAGVAATAKVDDIAAWLKAIGADAAILAALDSIAWTFNIRGRDVPRTPVPLAHAIVHADGGSDLFAIPGAINGVVRDHLGGAVRLHGYGAVLPAVAGLRGRVVAVDPDRTPAALIAALEQAGAELRRVRDPALLAKAVKNPVEIAGHRRAQLHDGIALCRFLHWLALEGPTGAIDECTAADKLEGLRREGGELRDLAFDTISAAGPNGAVIHYRPSPDSARPLSEGSLYLCDSGAQYAFGTTDVTRTVAIGRPTREMRRRFTEALRGHIRLATAVFPEGTNGGQLDALARLDLWASGRDYPYGTGHGVGSFLGGHEGPQRIAHRGDASQTLLPGMIVSNEPGYYKPGSFGLRIENLMLVVRKPVAGAEHPMLGFEVLTRAPIDRSLVVAEMLTTDERDWLDAYHRDVLAFIGPHVDEAVRAWLARACRPVAD